MRNLKEDKGITLIALIITIVVLLILAVVAINAVTGDGIIQHATNAKTSYENAQAVENSIIGEYEAFLEKNTSNKKIISFTCVVGYFSGEEFVNQKTYQLKAEEGMTWKQYCDSDYNEFKFTYSTSSDYIFSPQTEEVDSGTIKVQQNSSYVFVTKDDIIIKGIEYKSDIDA